ncbi:restriction endonuclease subunit S [Campylobacter ureolyticus]|nr:restriction endonuclease subunit S [Campylobacter ureolyticus]
MKQNRLSLNDVEWGEFFIKDIFTFTERGKRLKINDREVGNIPFITAGESNNGISSFINNKKQKKYYKAITIDMFGNAYYQEEKFTCDDNITILKNKSFSKEIYLFLTSRLNILKYKYSYGKQLRPNRLNRDRIMLPIDSNSNPNWKFMEDYIKQEQKDIAQKVISYYEQKILETGFDLIGLEDIEWKQFRLNEIFNIYTGRDIIISKVKEGIYPIITHSIENNGIGAFSQEINNRKLFNYKNTISLADRGNFHAYVQSHDFYIGTRVKALELRESLDDAYLLKFLCMSINKQKVRFSYGFNATNNVDNIIIILPSDKSGNPHWKYMSKFMKKLEVKNLEKVLEYIYIYIYIYID